LQLVVGAGQTQLLDWHVMPPVHACVQLPQWLLSELRSAQEPEPVQRVNPVGHPDAHAKRPAEGPQTGVLPEQTVVHVPQCAAAERSVSHPSLGLDEQCA
jgi:hypothetical protein